MPAVKCRRCETIFELPYRRDSDMPPLTRSCPICGADHVMLSVEPSMAGKAGSVQRLQEQLAAEASVKPARLIGNAAEPRKKWPIGYGPIQIRIPPKPPMVKIEGTDQYEPISAIPKEPY